MVQEGNQNRNISPQAHRYHIDDRHFSSNYLHSSAFTFNIGFNKTGFEAEVYKQLLDKVMDKIIEKQKTNFMKFVNHVTSVAGIERSSREEVFMKSLNQMVVKEAHVQDSINTAKEELAKFLSFDNKEINKDFEMNLDKFLLDTVNEAFGSIKNGGIGSNAIQKILNSATADENGKIIFERNEGKDSFKANDQISKFRNKIIDAIAKADKVNPKKYRALFYGAANSNDLMAILIGIGLKTENGKKASYHYEKAFESYGKPNDLIELVKNINTENILSQKGTKSSIMGAFAEEAAEAMLQSTIACSTVLEGITVSNKPATAKINNKTVKRDIELVFTSPSGNISRMGISVKSLKFIELSSKELFFQHTIDNGDSLDYLINRMKTVDGINTKDLNKFRYIVTNYATLRTTGGKTGYGKNARATGTVNVDAIEEAQNFTKYLISAYMGMLLGTTFEKDSTDENLMENGMLFHPYGQIIVPIYKVLENAKVQLQKSFITAVSFNSTERFSAKNLYLQKYELIKKGGYPKMEFTYPKELINLGSSNGLGRSAKIKYQISMRGLQDLLKY